MLVITQQQMDMYALKMKDDFCEKMVTHLQQDFQPNLKNLNIKEDDLKKLVISGIEKAESYGFTTQGDVELYLDCMILLGLNFDNDPNRPEIADILSQKETSSSQKAEYLHSHLIFNAG